MLIELFIFVLFIVIIVLVNCVLGCMNIFLLKVLLYRFVCVVVVSVDI